MQNKTCTAPSNAAAERRQRNEMRNLKDIEFCLQALGVGQAVSSAAAFLVLDQLEPTRSQ